jgi:hypothetical protein
VEKGVTQQTGASFFIPLAGSLSLRVCCLAAKISLARDGNAHLYRRRELLALVALIDGLRGN